jgi:hypothetical protein
MFWMILDSLVAFVNLPEANVMACGSRIGGIISNDTNDDEERPDGAVPSQGGGAGLVHDGLRIESIAAESIARITEL